MGFGLNVAPSIMQRIVDAILTKHKCIQQATSAYIDDVYVDESVVPAGTCKGASQQLWPPQQGAGEATGWCASAWVTGLGRG